MDIDVLQLPIPDWGLSCPRCDYPLKHLTMHRCPECGTQLDLPSLVKPWTRLRDPRFTGLELPLPDFGLECEGCGAPLAGAPQRNCPACDRPFDPGTLVPDKKWFVLTPTMHGGLPVPLIESVFTAEQVPHLVRQGQNALGMPTVQVWAPAEFYFEVRWLLRRMRQQIEAGRVKRSEDSWRCPHCGAKNPATFDECWHCRTVAGCDSQA
jgi:hypothetical protein